MDCWFYSKISPMLSTDCNHPFWWLAMQHWIMIQGTRKVSLAIIPNTSLVAAVWVLLDPLLTQNVSRKNMQEHTHFDTSRIVEETNPQIMVSWLWQVVIYHSYWFLMATSQPTMQGNVPTNLPTSHAESKPRWTPLRPWPKTSANDPAETAALEPLRQWWMSGE